MKTGVYFKLFAWSLILAVCLGMIGSNAESAWYDDAEWYDEFYQYRIPVEVTIGSTGLQILNVSEGTIASAINAVSLIDVSDTYFDYDKVIVVEYDSNGDIPMSMTATVSTSATMGPRCSPTAHSRLTMAATVRPTIGPAASVIRSKWFPVMGASVCGYNRV